MMRVLPQHCPSVILEKRDEMELFPASGRDLASITAGHIDQHA
jgi:hypothetical protein